MAGGLGYHFGQALLDLLMGNQSFTPPATWYAALFTAAPADGGGGTEVSAGGYSRIAVTNNTTNFPSANSSASQSTGTTITWGPASGSWGSIVAIGFYDASSSGNLGLWGPLAIAKTISTPDSFSITSANGTFTAS